MRKSLCDILYLQLLVYIPGGIMSEVKRPRKDRRTFLGTIAPYGVIALLFASLFSLSMSVSSQVDDVPVSIASTSVSPEPTPPSEQVDEVSLVSQAPSVLSPATLEPPREAPKPIGQPSRLVYEAANIDLPIQMMNQANGPFVPPESNEFAYWLTQRPGYLLAHSAEREKWPFNALTTAARVGDIIALTQPAGEVYYKVTDVTSYPKYDLEVDGKTPVWDIDDRLLRLIGCKDGDVWQQVTVVTATIQ